MLICCSYICGTLIYLEAEKITRSRELAMNLQVQAEAERKRIASDLHDEALPSLSRVMRLADQLQEELPDNDAPEQMRKELESTVAEMRRIINDLHPAVLENLGLPAALQHLTDRIGHDTSIQARFKDDSSGTSLPPFHSLCIFRIAQEALNNTEKHSGASQVFVHIEETQNTLYLRISDNGCGVIAPNASSHGLQNIAYRARLIGARADWKVPNTFERGTMLVLTLPLETIVDQKLETSKL